MGKQLFTNNAAATLYGTLPQGATTLILAQGTGGYFPAPADGDYFLATLYEKNASGEDERIEIVRVIGRVADALTIERDFEEMVGEAGGYAYPSSVGKTVFVELRWTAWGAGNVLQRSANFSDLDNPLTAKVNLGLSNVDNTTDANKPISSATQAALALKADLVSPAFTTPDIGVATGTSFNSITGLSSTTPVMDGVAAIGTNTTTARGDHVHPTDTSRASVASPVFTGKVTAPQHFNVTQPYGALQVAGADVLRFGSDNSGQLAGFRNKIINGDCRVTQRGTVPAVNNEWTYGGSDRICFGPSGFTALTGSINRISEIENCGDYWQAAVITTTGVGNVSFQTRLESEDVRSLNGKTVTARVRVFNSCGITQTVHLYLNKPTTSGNNFTAQTTLAQTSISQPAGALQDITLTYTLGAQEASLGLAIEVAWINVGAVTNITFATTNWQLEEGSIATPQERRPTGLDMALCMRYFERQNYKQNTMVSIGAALYSEYAVASLYYLRKIHNPTITISSGITPLRIPPEFAGGTWISEVAELSSARIATSGASGFVAGNTCAVFVNAPNQYIDISAEL